MSLELMRRLKVQATLDPAFRAHFLRQPLHVLQQYDLTDEEKQQIILPHFGWLVDRQLAALSYPESADALSLLSSLGMRVILNLAEIPLPTDMLQTTALLSVHLPIADVTTPTLEQVRQGRGKGWP